MSKPKQTELIPKAEQAIANAEAPADILAVIQSAVDSKVSVDTLERLMALHERHEDREARKAFVRDLLRFHELCPEIPREKRAEVKKGGVLKYTYDYASLDGIAKIIRPLLFRCGFTFDWSSSISEDRKMLVTCTLMHHDGHARSATFTCPTDSSSPGMSEQQKHGGALTFGKRQTLVAVTGLTMLDDDTDGGEPPSGAISDKQATALDALIKDTGSDLAAFLRFMKVEAIEDIRVTDFGLAKRTLEEKARRKEQGA